jgi:SAM-dependent methyltransferase
MQYRMYGWLRDHVSPFARSSQYKYFHELLHYAGTTSAWLDFGCGRQLVYDWLRPEVAGVLYELVGRVPLLIGADADHHSLRDNPLPLKVVSSARALPFANTCFDLVTANMVLEHLEQPVSFLKEISRVLKPNGVFLFHTPNRQSLLIAAAAGMPESLKRQLARALEGRAIEDVFPTRYQFNTLSTISSAAREAGFAIDHIELTWTAATTAALGPLSFFELLTIRLLDRYGTRRWRPCIIGALRKPVSCPVA